MAGSKHFVLVHGAGHGAWCWYRIVHLLQQAGHKVSALDLASAGKDSADPNTLETVHQLAAPLISFLQALPEKVVLVVHSMGGLSGTLAMELFPDRIAVTVFLAALMLPDPNHQNAGNVLETIANVFAKGARNSTLTFGNGPEKPPTSMRMRLGAVKDIFYHLSPSQDVALAKLCLKAFPPLKLTDYLIPTTRKRYGSVPRVYIECDNDKSGVLELADLMCQALPPKQRISVHADHSPFFSAPADLVAHLLLIAQTYA